MQQKLADAGLFAVVFIASLVFIAGMVWLGAYFA